MPDVVAAIEKVRQVAQASGKGLSEANAIHKLIMPVLKALGWDVDDIEHEYACKGGGAVDIALMLGGKPRVMVEAKAYTPGASPSSADKNTLQTISYGAAEGVEWCLLTNGGKYELYNTTVSLPLGEKLVLAVDVMSGTAEEAARRLGLLSLESVSSGQLDQEGPRFLVESRLRQWLKDADEELVDVIGKKLKGKVPEAAVRAGMRVVGGGKGAVTKALEPLSEPALKPAPGAQGDNYGQLARRRPVVLEGEWYRLWRVRHGDGKLGQDVWIKADEVPKLVAGCVALGQAGEPFRTLNLALTVYGDDKGRHYWDSLETMSLLYVLGGLQHAHGKHPQYFRLVEGMTEAKIMALLEQALEEDKDKAGPQ